MVKNENYLLSIYLKGVIAVLAGLPAPYSYRWSTLS